MSSSANPRSKRNRAEKHHEHIPSLRNGIDPAAPQDDSLSSQINSTLEIGRSGLVSNDSPSDFHPSASHASTTGPRKSNNDQHPGHGSISGQPPRRRPDVRQGRLRELIPAAPRPNASVIENQRKRHNGLMSANYVSMGRRATSGICHLSFPYPMTGRPSNYRSGNLSRNSAQLHMAQRYPRLEYSSVGSRATRLGQPNGLTGVNLPVVNQSLNVHFSHPIPERVRPRTMHSNADSQLHVLSQNPGDFPQLHGIESLDPSSMDPSRSYLWTIVNRNPILSETGLPNMPMPGSYFNQPLSVSMQVGMHPIHGMPLGQLQPQPGSSRAPAGHQPDNYNGFVQSQPTPSYTSTNWQLQSHPHFPMPIQTPLQTSTSQMDSFGQPLYANSQAQYFTPPFKQTVSNLGFPRQINPLVYFPSHIPALENDGQSFEHPAQLLPEDGDDVDDFIVSIMDSFDHVV